MSSNDLQTNPPVFQHFPGLEITQYAKDISEGSLRQNYLQNISKLFGNGGYFIPTWNIARSQLVPYTCSGLKKGTQSTYVLKDWYLNWYQTYSLPRF